MTIIKTESFDGYGGTVGYVADAFSLFTASTASLVTGRSGSGKALRMAAASELLENLAANEGTIFIQFGYRVPSLTNTALYLLLKDSGSFQCSCQVDVNGRFIFRRFVFPGGALLGQSTTLLAQNVWYHIGIMWTVHNSAGAIKLWINGALDVNLTGLDTRGGTANNYANTIDFFPTGGVGYDLDDIIFLNTSGGAPQNDFLGDCRVEAHFPDAAGTYADWAVTGAASGQAATSENPPDDDTSYISDSTSGHKSTFGVDNVTGTPTILAVNHKVRAKKDDAGAAGFHFYRKSGGTETDGAAVAPGTTYRYYSELTTLDPATFLPWSASSFNSAEFGVKTP